MMDVRTIDFTWKEDVDDVTLRDMFAMAALTGIVAKYGDGDATLRAKGAYNLADAMLKQREKNDG